MPQVIQLEGRHKLPTFLSGNPVGDWILQQPAPIALGLTLALSAVTGAVVGGAVIWAKNKVSR